MGKHIGDKRLDSATEQPQQDQVISQWLVRILPEKYQYIDDDEAERVHIKEKGPLSFPLYNFLVWTPLVIL
ncbi:MAG: hypothetical protein LBB62_06100 [Proteiniphilum sp.]|nr:hypothetical protein [Proteiniphilum sp.]